MIINKNVNDTFKLLQTNHTYIESVHIILNSLSILGIKNIKLVDELDKKSYDRINKYKYPERLVHFMKLTNEKSTQWKNSSFVKIALR